MIARTSRQIKWGAIVAALCLLLSCGEKQSDTLPVYSVDVQQRDSANRFFSGYDYVMLETNDSCLVGDVEGMKVDDTVIGIRECNRVLLFGRDGKLIAKIDKRGRGAGEYLSVRDFCVRDSLVYVLPEAQKCILVYDRNADFVHKIELDDNYYHFEILDGELMLLSSEYSNDSRYNFVVYNYIRQGGVV